jgi:hypothetical protein
VEDGDVVVDGERPGVAGSSVPQAASESGTHAASASVAAYRRGRGVGLLTPRSLGGAI